MLLGSSALQHGQNHIAKPIGWLLCERHPARVTGQRLLPVAVATYQRFRCRCGIQICRRRGVVCGCSGESVFLCSASSNAGRLGAQVNHVDRGLRDRRHGLPLSPGQDSLHMGQNQRPDLRFHVGRAEQAGVAGLVHRMPGRCRCTKRSGSNFLYGCPPNFAMARGASDGSSTWSCVCSKQTAS